LIVGADEQLGLGGRLAELEEPEVSHSYGKTAYIFIGLLVAYVIVRGVVGAASRLFWFDELSTLTIASQPTLHDMWAALRSGYDGSAPLFLLVERAALKVTNHKEIALRLPSIFAFPCTLICLYVYAKKRNGEILACLCALLFLSTSLFHTYLTEARAYSMVVACIAFAMVCYQRLPSGFWAGLFAFALLVGGSLHYYTVFAMIPFWVAEGLYFLQKREFRWSTWSAFVCGVLPIIFFWPFLQTIKNYYGQHMFAQPNFSAVRSYYGLFFLVKENAIGLAIAVMAAVAIVWSRLFAPPSGASKEFKDNGKRRDLAEAGLLLSFVGLPLIIFLAVRITHGILLIRYTMAATIGLALGAVIAVSIAGRKAAALFALFAFSFVGVNELSFWFHREFDPFAPYFSASSAGELQRMNGFVQRADHKDLPVVVSDCLIYSQFVYYLKPSLTGRMFYLSDAKRELLYTQADSSSRALMAFSKFFPVQVADYSQFTSAHSEFLLYSEGLDWDVPAFLGDGFSLQLVANDLGKIYLVKTNKSIAR
jgi:4-amino-4-deoxy-L-arabinose transferase-like glycosyltransferase